jgi:hypothetical protein
LARKRKGEKGMSGQVKDNKIKVFRGSVITISAGDWAKTRGDGDLRRYMTRGVFVEFNKEGEDDSYTLAPPGTEKIVDFWPLTQTTGYGTAMILRSNSGSD